MGVGVKCLADTDDMCLISCVLDDGFRRHLCVCGDDGSKQAIEFFMPRMDRSTTRGSSTNAARCSAKPNAKRR